MGFHVEDDLQLALDKLEVICFVKKYDRSTLGSPGRHGIRYAVSKTYPLHVVQEPARLIGTSSSAVDLAASDDNQQFFTPSMEKQVVEIESSIEDKKAEHPTSSAKRPLDFMSSPPEIQRSDDTQLSSGKDDATTSTPEIYGDAKSPMKKERDKLKLN